MAGMALFHLLQPEMFRNQIQEIPRMETQEMIEKNLQEKRVQAVKKVLSRDRLPPDMRRYWMIVLQAIDPRAAEKPEQK